MRTIEAQLNYLGPMRERPVFHGVDPSRTNLVLEAHRVEITDARTLAEPPSLDCQGFQLVEHHSAVRDLLADRALLETRYLEEIAELVAAVTGASAVRASPGPVARYTDRKDASKSEQTAPAAAFVHGDYTDRSARDHFLPQVIDPDEALRRYSRITVYQTWRALSEPPQDKPLAIADGRSVSIDDMIVADTILGDEYGIGQSFEYSMCRFNPEQRWFYFSNMRRHEVLIFRGHDFDRRSPRIFHSAFDDPSAPPDAPPRASIEARVFAFFEE